MKKLSVFPLILSTILLFSCKGTNQDTAQVVTDTVPPIPNITEKGIEPFVIGASLFDIPVKGAFYDTIILEKYYAMWYGEAEESGLTESEFKQIYSSCNYYNYSCYGVVFVIKDKDTVLVANIDGDSVKISDIEIRSSLLQLENGIHIGMCASELANNYNATFMGQSEHTEEATSLSNIILINIPSIPQNITIHSYCDYGSKTYEALYNYFNKKANGVWNYDYEKPIPLDIAKDFKVTSILIR